MQPHIARYHQRKNILDHSKNINLGNEDAFYKTLLGISLRRLGQIDLCLKEYIKKPIKKNKSIIKANIIIGAAQILFMNTPNYAAVNDAVKIAKIILLMPKPINFEVHNCPVSSTVYFIAYQKHMPIGIANMKFDNTARSFHQSHTNCELN